MKLGKVLKNLRVDAGLSQREVSVKMGYTTPQLISNNERDISLPPMSSLKKLASIYNVETSVLYSAVKTKYMDKISQKLDKKFYGRKAKTNTKV